MKHTDDNQVPPRSPVGAGVATVSHESRGGISLPSNEGRPMDSNSKLGDWRVAGRPNGEAPEVGKTYEVRHSRKGAFSIRVTDVSALWCTGVIVDGVASAVMSCNVRYKGENITVRDIHSYFIPLAPSPTGGA